MKNLLKLFGLSIVLSIAGLNAFENPSEKNYVDAEDITFEEGNIYLHLKNGDLKPVAAVYSDEKGVYVLDQDDDSDQNAEPDVLSVQDNQDELDQPTEQAILYTQDAQEALNQSTEQEAVCTQDNQLNQPTEQEIFYTQDNQDALDQTSKEETLCAQNAYRELVAGYECPNCGRINPRYRKTCKDCNAIMIH
ncbi:hypothetical protein [Candidatus Rhabdochlamydia sp. T3358]|uniref:hypothetical protein n=1 Tax=Candidatus Rhabdochlamydia sp. T3358 TaxID=2099795 RepID=UPI0010B442E9|nr:hypothetical protein [Candidatus Rhabdochlamydia sp. T3358]VHO04008.1 hypothetical protein RHT_01172 [Candidatus Rhabdochlamydia sp. T3358]